MYSPSPLITALSDHALQSARDLTINRLVVGQDVTAVELSSGAAGTAMHFYVPDPLKEPELHEHYSRQSLEQHTSSCPGHLIDTLSAPYRHSLQGAEVRTSLEKLHLDHPLERSLWLSLVNALCSTEETVPTENFFTLCGCTKETTLGVVGYFRPMLNRLRNQAGTVHVFDLRPNLPDCHPATKEPELLPLCDQVIITGTTLLNDTLWPVLDLCKNAQRVILTGPSVPFAPQAFKDTPVTHLAGTKMDNMDAFMRALDQGLFGRSAKAHLRKHHLTL